MGNFLKDQQRGITVTGSVLALAYALWVFVQRLVPAFADGTAIGAELSMSFYDVPFVVCGVLGLTRFLPPRDYPRVGVAVAYLVLTAVTVFATWVSLYGGDALAKGVMIIVLATPVVFAVLLYLVRHWLRQLKADA